MKDGGTGTLTNREASWITDGLHRLQPVQTDRDQSGRERDAWTRRPRTTKDEKLELILVMDAQLMSGEGQPLTRTLVNRVAGRYAPGAAGEATGVEISTV